MKLQQNKAFAFGNALFGKQDAGIRDRIAQKKQLRQKEAMHVVTTAHKAERSIDKTIEDGRDRIRQLQKESEEANAVYKDYKQKMAQAKADYEVEDDSQEQKDLELLQKAFDIEKHGSMTLLTEEEQERLDGMGELTDYQKLAMELYEQADVYKSEIETNNLKVSGEAGAIRSIERERVKEHGMVDAETAKKEILQTASDEVISMLVEDSQKHMDEKAEEAKEAAEKRKEKKEEEEKRVEAAKENKTEAEAVIENIQETVEELTEQMTDSNEIMEDVNAEIKKIMQEQKMLEEDIKGLSLDVIR